MKGGPVNAGPARPAGGNETILMVEDQGIVRRMTVRILQALGYSIIEAANGREGHKIFADRNEEIDLVILDLTMPEMSGTEMLQKMKEINPRLKVIITSGYPRDEPVNELVRQGAGFLQKPFPIEELADAIRRLLGQPQD
ncbi:MAG: response regulator [Pseudomonadota bacterium]